MLGKSAGIIGKVFTLSGKAASLAISAIAERVVTQVTSIDFESILNTMDRSFTPVVVRVTCNHFGEDAEDYTVIVDLNAFESALAEGRRARPQLVVYSKYTTIDRTTLAARMETALRPLIAHYEQHVSAEKSKILAQRESDEFWIVMGTIMLAVAGSVLGPVLWLLIGLDGWRALKNLPQLFIAGVKSSLYKLFFGDELSQLDNELESARTTINIMVKNMEIQQL